MQTCPGPLTPSPQGSSDFAPGGAKGIKGCVECPDELQKKQADLHGSQREQTHNKTSLNELTTTLGSHRQ